MATSNGLNSLEATATGFAHDGHFERIRRSTGLVAGPLAFGIVWVMTLDRLEPEAHRLAAVVALTIVWWFTEAIPLPVTALVSTGLSVLLGVATPERAFSPYASPIIFVFLGAFVLGRAMSAHALDARFAASVLHLPFVRRKPTRARPALGWLTIGLSAWMNNTATAAMMAPLARGVLGANALSRGYAAGFMLVIGYAATIGGMITPIGAAPNLITIGLLDTMSAVRMDFTTWILLCTPVAIATMAALLLMSAWMFPSVPNTWTNSTATVARPGGWTRGQINCLLALAVAAILWIAPGVLANMAPDSGVTALAEARLNEGVVAVLAACLLFVLPTSWEQRRFTLTWQEASEIDWGTILMFGGGMAIGRLMLDTGLAEVIGQSLVRISGAQTLWAVTAMAAAAGILMTELISNTACISMLVPVVIGICQVQQLNPVPPALAVCLGGSLSFMLPISTPPNAIAYSTGLIPLRSMITCGLLLDVAGFVIIMVALRILCPLLGYA